MRPFCLGWLLSEGWAAGSSRVSEDRRCMLCVSPPSSPEDAELQRQTWRETVRRALETELSASCRGCREITSLWVSLPNRDHHSTEADRGWGDPGGVWCDFHRSWDNRGLSLVSCPARGEGWHAEGLEELRSLMSADPLDRGEVSLRGCGSGELCSGTPRPAVCSKPTQPGFALWSRAEWSRGRRNAGRLLGASI